MPYHTLDLFQAALNLCQAMLEREAQGEGYTLPKGYMDMVAAKSQYVEAACALREPAGLDVASRVTVISDNKQHFADILFVLSHSIIVDADVQEV